MHMIWVTRSMRWVSWRLYNCISNIQKLDEATTLSEVKEIVDTAVARAERGGLKKAFSIIASHRYDEDDYVILREKDFEF